MKIRHSRLFKAVYRRRTVLKRIMVAVFALVVITLLTVALFKVDWPAVWRALQELPSRAVYRAAVFAVLTYAVYSCFDLLGRRYTGHHLARSRSMLVGFISYAFTMTLGSTIGGVGLRARLYSKQGLRQGQIVRIWAISVMTNWIGYLFMFGLVLTAGRVRLPEAWDYGRYALYGAGALCLALVLAYIVTSGFLRGRPRVIWGHTIDAPGLRLTLVQILLGSLVWGLLAAVPYMLFQGRVPYVEILGIVLLAAVAGLAARIPGGLGVIEYVFLTLLAGEIPRNEILAVLLVYRLLYYIGPLMIAGCAYLLAEAGLKSVRRGPG